MSQMTKGIAYKKKPKRRLEEEKMNKMNKTKFK